jgi:hypothetical protein
MLDCECFLGSIVVLKAPVTTAGQDAVSLFPAPPTETVGRFIEPISQLPRLVLPSNVKAGAFLAFAHAVIPKHFGT